MQRPENYGIGRMFDMMSDAIVGTDLEHQQIVLWNPAAEALFGYTPDEAIGMDLSDLVPPDQRAAHDAGIHRYAAGGEPVLVGRHPVEVPARTRSGKPLVIQLTVSDVTVGEGRRSVVAVIRDVTELRRAEEDLRKANDAMRLLLASASHDLRTPLTSILGFAELLARPDAALGEAQRRDFAEAIVRSAGRATRMVESILALSKIRAGVMSHQVQRLNLEAAARDAVAMTGVDANIQVAGRLHVETDPDLLNRVIVNLVSNAERHGAPPITVEATARAGHVDLVVTDHGPGVASDVVDRLFEPFARGVESPQGGSGLGLAIVAELADAWGGAAYYEPAPDGGSRFGVRIPTNPGAARARSLGRT